MTMAAQQTVWIIILSVITSVISQGTSPPTLPHFNSTTAVSATTQEDTTSPAIPNFQPSPTPATCPKQCICSEARRAVSCDNKGLTDIPTGIPSYVWFLTLNGNRFQNISAFAFSDLPNLVSIQLVSCAISFIHPNAFMGLSQLRNLDLRSNLLEHLPNGTLQGLTAMTELELQGNNIETIAPSAFQGLANMNKVYFDGNQISNLSFGTFSENPNLEVLSLRFCKIKDVGHIKLAGLENLKELDLSGNAIMQLTGNSFDMLPSLVTLHLSNMFPKLSEIDVNAFRGLTSLKTLDISDNSLRYFGASHVNTLNSLEVLNMKNNPWICNCQMGGLLEWLRMTTIDYFDPLWQCNSPQPLQGQIVFTVFPVEKFACTPYIFDSPDNTAIDYQSPAVFTVSVEGDPTPKVEWYLPSGELITSRGDSTSEYVEANGNVMVIQQALDYHTGEYRITAHNSLGMTTLFFQVLVLNIPTPTIPVTTLTMPDTTTLPPPCIYAPIKVRVTDITDTTATLLWTSYNSSDLRGYIIHQNEFGNQDSIRTYLADPTDTSRSLQSLQPNSFFILCVSVFLQKCPSFTSLDQCAQITTKGDPSQSEVEALRVKHRNELIILAFASVTITLLLVATIFLIFWRFKQPKSLRKYEFQATEDTIRFADLEPVDITAIAKRSSGAATPMAKNGSVFTFDNPLQDHLNEEHEYETPSEFPMKTFQAEIHKEPLPPDPPDVSSFDDSQKEMGLATLLSELKFQQEASDLESDTDSR
ncbi:Leucine-rich repeat-containing protein 4 [Holothuria leucospilota]|uniref:Leucine-rich repeat-containing protein 4 n=1 Tax=Holothuria leucospilota TaxID=206669 RepID=A0A9Q1CL47_HOLLE|nr:Leucine-rich repeat-containing protein 4 [Holothuria leucospilota]